MRASDRAYATLLDGIQSGEMPPGSVVGEVEQAERLGVSRTPMREAIGRLVADGLVRQQSPRVLVVSGFDADDIRELFEARRALEETAARIAAERGDRQLFAALAAAFDGAHPETGDVAADEYYALISRFDAAVDAAVDNTYLTSALRTIRTHLVRARRLARGDAELAAHATHVHLHNALASILSSIADSGRGSPSPTPEGPQ
jgi:DNA-binding GntR family transcriptional regulator